MKLLTLNCHSWREEDQVEKIKYLAKVIKENKYDVIGLQEVSQGKDSTVIYENIREDNYAELLIKELNALGVNDYNYIWDFSHIGYDIYEEGLAIVSKHPIKDKEIFYISKSHSTTFYKSRKIIKAAIDINGTELNFYSCHLGWWDDDVEPFKYQADMLLNKITEKSFLLGDFNSDAFKRNEGYDYLMSKGIIDTFNIAKESDDGVTVKGEIDGWESSKSSKRMDLILTNIDSEVQVSRVIFNGINKDVISDHFGVEITL